MAKKQISKISLPLRVTEEIKLLGGRVSVARKKRNITQAQVAGLAGLSRLSVMKIEQGQPLVNIRNLLSIALVFEMRAEWLDFPIPAEEPIGGGTPGSDPRTEILTALGQKIKKIRKSRNLTLDDLHRSLFISMVTLRKIERTGQGTFGHLAAMLNTFDLLGELKKLFASQTDLIGLTLDNFRHQDRKRIR